MNDWKTCAVSDSFVKNKVGRQNQIPAKDITEIGRFPVVDQGQKFVAGYCDDESRVIDYDLPLIVFGDHTRCLKYVNFPFVLGADGTKVLLPNKKLYDPRFYYFALLALEIPSRGYNRHFKVLNERRLPLPPLSEQKKIAHILSTVQRAIEAQERIVQTTTELKKALMHKLFTEGLRREPQKQTESGLVPESWEVVPLSECAVVQTGIAKGRQVNVEEAVEVPYLRVANVQDGYLDLSEMKTITIRKNEQQRFALQDGDVVLTEGGDFDKLGRGFIWHGQIENCVHQNHIFAVRPDKMQISSEFFAYLSQSPYGKSYFLSVSHKTTNLACINTTKLKAFPVLLPPQDQQADIVVACSSIDGKIRNATNKKNQLQDLFRALLHELMTAKTRVHELDFPARGRAA
jgi:type I restriction enzyme S subunit